MAFGIFVQGSGGLHWVANADTREEAQAQCNRGDFDSEDVDFVLIISGVEVARDLDGMRETIVDGDSLLEDMNDN